ncbi:hypothetical protein BT93_L2020 [Corymbia citriodora subsp. variegata]|uniref:Exostosin GT47 domain-containing protein n=1 Tax=Corymbia citriodora subsp. variegata TaxID=360336 RepID=A0A8T0CWA0_CORYI|nr:hypothetical protein BT93_L2020 [Corymbia citriodora subsp. variegata]
MRLCIKFQMLFLSKNRRWLFLVALVAATHLMFQSLLLPYGNALQSLLPNLKILTSDDATFLNMHSSAKSVMVRNPLTFNISESTEALIFVGAFKSNKNFNGGKDIGHFDGQNRVDRQEQKSNAPEGSIDHVIEMGAAKSKEGGLSSDKIMHMSNSLVMQSREFENHTFVPVMASDTRSVSLELTVESKNITLSDAIQPETLSLPRETLKDLETEFHSATLTLPATPARALPSDTNNMKDLMWNASNPFHSAGAQNISTSSQNQSSATINPVKKIMRCNMPPKSVTTIEEMNHIYVRRRVSSRSMRPRWSSIRDQEILAAKVQIENAPVAVNNQELYSPLFRNVSMFIRSYQLMEQILKVYIYKEGEKPVFHRPILKGLYASEGWFMKLMKGNKQYLVKNPRKAHLFYMPFSSRMLEYAVYVRNSHNRTNLRQYLKQYTDKISARYPFFNRTGGADHFLVACHDWAPYETRHHMERCIKALCNADVTAGFKIGRDVSLPETYVRSARNPLRDLGGKPPSQRHVLAFYAGNNHGYLRPILLKHWKDKDPDMKIFGLMPPGVASKMSYIHHMKSSKYCICPKGYEVNSPRVVEAIFYECVPVIISDNFVPPFFEVLDWGAFSVILAEKDIPNLKNILLSIPEEKYKEMQLRVRKVQRHFLWHAKPVKYDLFYMTLHSIWYNRVFQIKLR